MYNDVIDLREFYETSLGLMAQRVIRRRIRTVWPDASGQILVGVGYATPYLRPFLAEAERTIALMPAEQGVTRWPPDGRGITALAEEAELPLPDMSVDRVLLVHALEVTEHLEVLMREIWRILNGSGRLLVVAPNRRGIWARSDRSPFGNGSPYSARQIRTTLKMYDFVPERIERTLYVPPFKSRFMMSTAPAWERMGSRFFERFSGIILAEASKQIYQVSQARTARGRARRPAFVPAPAMRVPTERVVEAGEG
jgi:SAM-dependent methyltransferase